VKFYQGTAFLPQSFAYLEISYFTAKNNPAHTPLHILIIKQYQWMTQNPKLQLFSTLFEMLVFL